MKVRRCWDIFIIATFLFILVGCSKKTQTSIDLHEGSQLSTDSFAPNVSPTPANPITDKSTPTVAQPDTPVTTLPTSISAGANNFAVAFSESGQYLAFNTNSSSLIYDTQQQIIEPGGVF